MLKTYVLVKNWMDSDEGATAMEYAILVALIAIVIMVGVGTFGNSLNNFFSTLWKSPVAG
jgi:pilus assembly protein Flp/PilA